MTVNDILEVLDNRTTAMTIRECAELLHVGTNTLYVHARTGKFPVFQVAGTMRVNPTELAQHIRARSNAVEQPKHGRA
jgi:excisionase family DNA binding protein